MLIRSRARLISSVERDRRARRRPCTPCRAACAPSRATSASGALAVLLAVLAASLLAALVRGEGVRAEQRALGDGAPRPRRPRPAARRRPSSCRSAHGRRRPRHGAAPRRRTPSSFSGAAPRPTARTTGALRPDGAGSLVTSPSAPVAPRVSRTAASLPSNALSTASAPGATTGALGALGDADDEGVGAQRRRAGSAESESSHGGEISLPLSSRAVEGDGSTSHAGQEPTRGHMSRSRRRQFTRPWRRSAPPAARRARLCSAVPSDQDTAHRPPARTGARPVRRVPRCSCSSSSYWRAAPPRRTANRPPSAGGRSPAWPGSGSSAAGSTRPWTCRSTTSTASTTRVRRRRSAPPRPQGHLLPLHRRLGGLPPRRRRSSPKSVLGQRQRLGRRALARHPPYGHPRTPDGRAHRHVPGQGLRRGRAGQHGRATPTAPASRSPPPTSSATTA